MKTLTPLLFIPLGFATAAFAQGPASAGLIIESRSGGLNFDHYMEPTGAWLDSAGKSRADGLTVQPSCGSRKITCGANVGTSGSKASARFSPKFTAKGHYYVYASWPRESNADPITFLVRNANGDAEKPMRLDGWGVGNANGNQWVPVGDYDFNPGDDQFVEIRIGESGISTPDPRNPCQVFADAIQFSAQPLPNSVSTVSPVATATPGPVSSSSSSSAPPLSAAVEVAPAGDSGPVEWLNDITTAQAKAAASGKRVLVFFSLPESNTSQYYETNVFTDAVVRAAMKPYVCVRLDFSQNSSIASNLGVFKAGTVMLYASNGDGLKKIQDRHTAQEFLAELK